MLSKPTEKDADTADCSARIISAEETIWNRLLSETEKGITELKASLEMNEHLLPFLKKKLESFK